MPNGGTGSRAPERDELLRSPAESSRVSQPRQIRTARFIKRKETPGTCVYQEQPPEGEPEIIGNLYLKKWFAGSATSITVTVEKG